MAAEHRASSGGDAQADRRHGLRRGPRQQKMRVMVRALVVGAGIAGLTTALRLAERGVEVTVVARDSGSATTSAVAAAIWFPYAAQPADRVEAWAAASYEIYAAQARRGDWPVRMTRVVAGFRRPTPPPRWCGAVEGFLHLPVAALPAGCVDGFALDAPLAEMPAYLEALETRLEGAGVRRVTRALTTLDEAADLAGEGCVVVHCSGLGARELVADGTMFPLWGQVVRVTGVSVESAVLDDDHPGGVTYVVPRSGDVVLGGCAERGRETPADPAMTASIRARCEAMLPELRAARVVSVAAAARPGRPAVRLERGTTAAGRTVVHNYGHGGCGMTLAWGCASEAAALVTG